MEELIKAVEKAIKEEEGMVNYHAKKLAEESKYHAEAQTTSQEKVLALKADLDELRTLIKKKITA